MKPTSLLLLLPLAVLALSAPTDKEIIQLTLNGLFEENKLPDPTTIVPCIDDTSAHQIVVFIGELLDKAAKGSLSDLLSLPQLIKEFGNSLDPAVGQCLDGNAEFASLAAAYNLTGADPDTIEKKVIAYVTLHYLTVHKWLVGLDDDWHAGNYVKVGFSAATYGHTVLDLASENPSDREILQQGLNGVFEENKLPDPTTILLCSDDDTDQKVVVFIGYALDKAARGSLSDLLSLPQLIKDFIASIPAPVMQCLEGNAEVATLLAAYNLTGADPDAIERKVIAYVTLHYPTVHKWLVECDGLWNQGNYYQAGFKGALYAHTVLGAQ